MNRKLIGVLLFSFCIALVGTGCRKGVPVTPYGNAIQYSGKIQTDAAKAEQKDKVKRAIIDAGSSLGWVMKPVNESTIEGTLYIRSHVAIVEIQYDATRYTINYKNSVNLNYKDGKIHPQYRNWVIRLQRQIDAELSKIM